MGDMWILFTVLRRVVVRVLRHVRRGIFLVPVAGMAIALFGLQPWTIAAVLLAVIVAFWRPVVAAALLPVSMVVAGISGLVVAATEPGSGFWTVSVLGALKQARIKAAIRRPPVIVKGAVKRAVKRVIDEAHQVPLKQVPLKRVAVTRLGPAGAPRGVVPVPGSARLNWNPAPVAQAVIPGGGQGVKFQVPAPPVVTAQMVPRGGGTTWHINSGGVVTSGFIAPGHGPWLGGLLVPLALLLLTLGLWLLPRSAATLRTHAAGLLALLRRRMLENRWGILLVPVALLGLTVFGVHPWTVAAILACVVTAVRWPLLAADLVPLALAAFAVRGFMIAASWPSLPAGLGRPALLYGGILVSTPQTAMLAGAEASAFLVIAAWLVPRTIGAHARTALAPGRDLELEGRVQRLTETRDLAVDAADTELRRIERNLHDGAQARLIALGMNLRAVERMLPGRPEAALALVAEARETSLRALNDLRDLVRGICPPVLADRGLGHAVRALALDTPFPVDLDINLPGRLSAPVESACYFAVAEALANAVRHSGARRVHIRMQHEDGILRIQVADDGAGGADPARGTGLRGVEQRLAAFDGIMAVSSPPGGPTMIAMEVPCALSSPKTCSF
jgi:signal transduction histidine kinase